MRKKKRKKKKQTELNKKEKCGQCKKLLLEWWVVIGYSRFSRPPGVTCDRTRSIFRSRDHLQLYTQMYNVNGMSSILFTLLFTHVIFGSGIISPQDDSRTFLNSNLQRHSCYDYLNHSMIIIYS